MGAKTGEFYVESREIYSQFVEGLVVFDGLRYKQVLVIMEVKIRVLKR